MCSSKNAETVKKTLFYEWVGIKLVLFVCNECSFRNYLEMRASPTL